MIVGIDEVGRGPWAGPLVVGAVVLGGHTIEGLTDSKKLSVNKRKELADTIYAEAVSCGLGWVHAEEIDAFGLSAALTEACKRALKEIHVPYHEIIIDGTVNLLRNTGKGPYVTTMKKADVLVPSVSAASIIAKVARDDWMAEQDKLYPDYGFKHHVGYGTKKHKEALARYGITPLHRRSFAPIAALHSMKAKDSKNTFAVTSKAIGDSGEDVAAAWLQAYGHIIQQRNWRTKFCEIDIITQKDDTVYFVEVKHRKKTVQGGGIAAITPAKLRQMRFAASLYLTKYKTIHPNARLAVITTTGEVPQFETWLEID